MIRALALSVLLLLSGAANAIAADFNEAKPLLATAKPVDNGPVLKLRPGTVKVVTFFASWCPPCTLEFRHLNAVIDQVPADKVQVIGVNLHEAWGGVEDVPAMRRFLDRTKPQFALVKGNDRISKVFGGIDRIPTVIVFAADGRELWRFVHKRGAKKTHATGQDVLDALKRANVVSLTD